MALLFGTGQPSDGTGSAGDYSFDGVNRIMYGPKTTTWNNTANSLTGPSGPALLSGTGAPAAAVGGAGQGYIDLATGNTYLKAASGSWGSPVGQISGAAGLSVLTGSNAPASGLGVNGQTYIDTLNNIFYSKANGAWSSGVSIAGTTGATGATLLTGYGAGVGQYGVLPATTLSATPTPIPFPGTTIPATFTPIGPSALLGVYAYMSATSTIALYNVTTSTTVWSAASPSGGGNTVTSYFPVTQYPLTAGNTYQFQLTGSASTAAQVEPYFLMPSNNPGLAVQCLATAGFSTSTTFSTTAQNLPVLGTSTLFVHVPVRTGGVYAATATYTPTGGTTSSSSVTLTLNYAKTADGSSAGTSSYTFAKVTANGLPQTIFGPQLTDLTSLTTGFYFYWKVTGTGTGTLTVNLYALV